MAAGQATRPAGADTTQRASPPQREAAAAPTTGPASNAQLPQPQQQQLPPKAEGSAVESQTIRRDKILPGDGANGGAARRDGNGKPVAPPRPAGFGLRNVALSLGAVLGLIFIVYWLIRQVFPGVAAARSSQAVRVLARSVLSPKQQVLLLQVGRRVIVVGDSGAQMNALAQIDDPDEIAALVGQLESEKRPLAPAFGGFFGRAKQSFDDAEGGPKTSVTYQGNASNEDDEQQEQEQPPTELGLSTAQGELRGLMDRVKELSQTFRKS